MYNTIKRGDIYYADLGYGKGSEQGGIRPVLIIQNDQGNRYSPTVIIAAITSSNGKKNIPTHVRIDAERYGLPKDSIILLEQIRTIDKSRLMSKICELDEKTMNFIDRSSKISIGLEDAFFNERYVYEKLEDIKQIDRIINKYKYKNDVDLWMEQLEKISLIGSINDYCKMFNRDSRIYLSQIYNTIGRIAEQMVV